MFRLSKWIEKLENRLEPKLGRFFNKHQDKFRYYIPLGLGGWYFYGMLINSIRLGKQSVLGGTEQAVERIWVVNPFRNLIAPFTPTGLATTAVCFLLFCLITKKGYAWFSGWKLTRDPRGFDIVADGTHGTSGFMTKKEQEKILLTGPVNELDGTLLGKKKKDPEEPDKFAEYVTLRPNCGLTEHILVYGATGSGKTRGFVKPFIIQCAQKKRKESMILVDPKGGATRS